MQSIVFIAALVLAIPTTGLSILAWIVYMFVAAKMKVKSRIEGGERIRSNRATLDPLVGTSPGNFFRALDIPKVNKASHNANHEDTCGSLLLNFISHNSGMPEAFVECLKLQRLKGSSSLPTGVEVAKIERQQGGGPLHDLCYFALSTLMEQNKMDCFSNIDQLQLKRRLADLELSGMLSGAR